MFAEPNKSDIRIDESQGESCSMEASGQFRKEQDDQQLNLDQKNQKKRQLVKVDTETVRKELSNQLYQTTMEELGEDYSRDPNQMAVFQRQNQQQEGYIQSEYTYDQLSEQLEKALNKIQGREKLKTQSFLDRVEYFQKKKEKQLRQKIEQKQLQESRLSAKVLLTNAHSQKILQRYQPIHQRYEKVLEEKKRRVEKQKIDKIVKQQYEIQQHMRQAEKKTENMRSVEEFCSSMNSWKQQLEKKRQLKSQQQVEAEMVGVTFTPAINRNSKLMAKRAGKVPIYEQGVKAKKLEIDKQCTFQPNLAKNRK